MTCNGQSSTTCSESLRKKIQHYSYTIQDKLGRGYSSEVFRGQDDRNGKTVAIKVISLKKIRQRGVEELLMQEISLLKELHHQNLVACHDVLMTSNNCYIVTDCYAQGDLASILAKRGRLGLDQGLPLILEMLAGLCYLHRENVIHRDIKPQNVLMHRRKPKLVDLGFAIKSQTIVKAKYKIGSPLYMSPQALMEREHSTKSDIWSLGVTMFQILQGRAPWQVKDEKQLRQAIKEEIKFKYLQHPEVQALISGCLSYDKQDRPTGEEILVKIEEMTGLKSRFPREIKQIKQNKENIANSNHQRSRHAQQSQQVKKSMRNNFNLLKWLINYSRFAAKLLPKLQELSISSQLKHPYIEFVARCLHMTISKLNRVDQLHPSLELTNYSHFKHTSRFAKIRAVSAQYQQKYLLMLAKLPFKYALPHSLALDITPQVVASLEQTVLSGEYQEMLGVVDGVLTLIQANLWAKANQPFGLSQMINFQLLIDAVGGEYDQAKIGQLLERKQSILGILVRKDKSLEDSSQL